MEKYPSSSDRGLAYVDSVSPRPNHTILHQTLFNLSIRTGTNTIYAINKSIFTSTP